MDPDPDPGGPKTCGSGSESGSAALLFSGGILKCVPSEFTETLKTAVHTNYLAILLLFMYGPILIVNIFHINCNNEVNALLT